MLNNGCHWNSIGKNQEETYRPSFQECGFDTETTIFHSFPFPIFPESNILIVRHEGARYHDEQKSGVLIFALPLL